MRLKEFQRKYHIKRIDFSKIIPSEYDKEYSSDRLICPYCGAKNEYEAEETDEILKGTPWQCCECEKWFYAEEEVSIDTTCTPIENKVLEPFTRQYIENNYKYMDKCDKGGCQWNDSIGVVEYKTYKTYAEPFFENMKHKEVECIGNIFDNPESLKGE